MTNPILFLLISILLVTSSQLLFKKGVMMIETTTGIKGLLKSLIRFLKNKYIIAGVVLNGFAAIFWLLALSELELSYVFPFLSINYILIPVGANLIFNERITRQRKIGIGIICIGIISIALS